MNAPLHHPLLFEMLRSFATLARHLNLSHAVDELKTTRQTVRRHIETLETTLGVMLFEIKDRRYQLTEDGHRALNSAKSLLAQGSLWLSGNLSDHDGLRAISYAGETDFPFNTQQQPASVIWNGDSEVLKSALKAWIKSEGHLESEHFEHLRPYVLVYRESGTGWICVEVGEQSFYSNWWGWTIARSSVGRNLADFPGGAELASVMELPFKEVKATEGFRIDQVATRVPRGDTQEPVGLCYNRLLLGSKLPDESFVLVVVVDRADTITIPGVGNELLEEMPEDTKVTYLV